MNVLRTKRFLVGASILGLLVLAAVFAELLASSQPRFFGVFAHGLVPHDPLRTSGAPLLAPSSTHWLGTDELGRDVFARAVFGTRMALGPAFAAVGIALFVGTLLGGAAGFVGRVWDRRLERIVQTVDTFPAIVVVLLLRVSVESEILSIVVPAAMVRMAEAARLVRVETLRLSNEEYIAASRALGARPLHLFWRHILPAALNPVTVCGVFGVGSVVLLEAAASFLAPSLAPVSPSWGEMLAEAGRHPHALWLLFTPMLLLFLTVGASYLLADVLRDVLDPRAMRHREGKRRRAMPAALAG